MPLIATNPTHGTELARYGGTKRSGYGRELGEDGIREFVDVKSVALHAVAQ